MIMEKYSKWTSRGTSQCSNCGNSYSNAWKPKHCQKCAHEIGGSYVPKPKKQKLHVPSEKCVVVVDSEDLKIFSVELTYRHNSVCVVQAEGNFVCHSDKCKEKRAVHMASDVSFACDHTKLLKSYCHPTSAKNLTEEDITNYKCDNRTRTMLLETMHPPQDFRHVVQITGNCYAVFHGGSHGPSNPTGYFHILKDSDGQWFCTNKSCGKKSGNSKQLKVRHICAHLHILFCLLRLSSIPPDTTSTSNASPAVSSTPDIEQESLAVSRSSTIALNMKRKVPYPVPQEFFTACRDLSDISCFVPSQSTCDLCASPLSAGRRHPGQGPDDVSYLLTPWIFSSVEILVKVCTNKECKAMHQVWPINQGLFNICDKVILAIEILEHWRELFKRGVPLNIAIDSSLCVWTRCRQVQLSDSNLKYITGLLYNGFYAFQLLSNRSLDSVVCGICGVIGQVHFGDGNEKNCCSIDLGFTPATGENLMPRGFFLLF
ncbi:uncharacterized protein [Montipora capricornis]|uniref:uncharacterized protein isoform X2 n=1 Tax=Montipora capricornis TaxID=246305 RepID=UPI0035F1FAA7